MNVSWEASLLGHEYKVINWFLTKEISKGIGRNQKPVNNFVWP